MSYDAAGNLTNDGYQTYTYDATGQQTSASGTLTQSYDGDGLRVKKVESGVVTYYLRSSVLGGQVITELGTGGSFQRGYVYLGSQMLAIQKNDQVSWVHQDPVTKSQRVTNSSGAVTSTIDLDPWGGETARSSSQAFQPHRYTTYERDVNGGDEAMMRRYTGKWHRFSQPDPFDGSYNLTNPQSFSRYAYVQNDPANFVDPLGLDPEIVGGVLGNGLAAYVGPFASVTVGDGGDGGEMVEPIRPGRPMIEPGLNPQKPQPLPTDLKDKVANIVNNPETDCAEFIKKLIGTLQDKAFSDDPMKLFERVEKEKSFRLGKTGKYGGLASITGGKRQVTIRPVSSTTDPRLSEHQANAYAVIALNELMHHAKDSGVYLDRQLARAISRLLLPDQLVAHPLPKTNDVDMNSAYFHSLFNLHCHP
jgi:RHS repeat-associated protein